jgi:hypothetical protein
MHQGLRQAHQRSARKASATSSHLCAEGLFDNEHLHPRPRCRSSRRRLAVTGKNRNCKGRPRGWRAHGVEEQGIAQQGREHSWRRQSDCRLCRQARRRMRQPTPGGCNPIFAGGRQEMPGQALRLAITQSGGAESDRILFIRKEDEEVIAELEEHIAFLLEGTAEHGIAAATRALWKLLAREPYDDTRTN